VPTRSVPSFPGNGSKRSPTRCTFPMPPAAHGSTAWPTKASRAGWSAHAPVHRPKSQVRSHRPSSALAIPPPSSLVPSRRRGAAAHWRWSWPTRPGANWVVHVGAGAEKKEGSSERPTGRRAPAPAALASGSLARAALESRARRGDILVLSEDATRRWRLARPRAGWWRNTLRARLPRRPLRPSPSTREASLQRQAWWPYRSWRCVTSGVWRRVRGAGQDGTAKVFSKVVPHGETEGVRPSSQPGLVLLSHTGQEVGMVADRSGIHRAHQLASTLPHGHEQCRWPRLPAPCGHPRHPLEGFWRVRQDRSGAGRGCPDLPQLYQRTRCVLTEHPARPISAFHW
jgi:hypothetical protein